MAASDEPIVLLSRALDQVGGLIAGVRPEQANWPTPCRSWDVRALANHMVDEVQRFAEVTGSGTRGSSDGDVIGDDWVDAYGVAAGALLAAWREPGALERTHRLPGGEIPATWAVGQHITELVIHAWDIAKATGQSTELDPVLGQAALEWGTANLLPEYRGDEAAGYHVGPVVAVREDAPLYDRIAAFGGRDPN
jgi:uncharacterized protein (TIGR03086 family)